MARQLEHEQGSGASLRGPRSFGRNDDGSVNKREAGVLRELWPRIINGESIYQWVQELNDRGITTSRGNPWTSPGLTYLLRNPRLAGVRMQDGKPEPIEGLEPIVSVEEHLQMCAVLDGRANERKPRTDNPSMRKYLLTGGIAKCGRCGKPLHAKRAESGNRGYSCIKSSPHFGCGRVRIAAEPLEEAVGIKVLGRLSNEKNLRSLQAAIATWDQTGRSIAEQIGELQNQQRDLGRQYAQKKIGQTAFQAGDQELERQVRELRTEMERVRAFSSLPPVLGPEDLARWWQEDSSIQERHDLVAVLVDEIRIEPSKRPGFRGFDQERVVYVWRAF